MDEYWKLYLQNDKLLATLAKAAEDKKEILGKILKIEDFYNENLEKL